MINKHKEQLIGIKAIADYLVMSERNIYYWEKKLGLPLHRISGSYGYRVYAYKDELDMWIKNKSTFKKKEVIKQRLFLVFSILFICFFIMAFFLFKILNKEVQTGPEHVSVKDNIVYVKDLNGKNLWSFDLGGIWTNFDLHHIVKVEDIDGDKQKELIAPTYNASQNVYYLTLFDNNGDPIWNKSISADLSFNETEIENFFNPCPVNLVKTKSNDFLIITKWNHMERFLSIITSHDKNGNLLSKYIHLGNL